MPTRIVSTVAGDGTADFKDGPAASARFHRPFGVAVHKGNGNVYVADADNHRIRLISNGQVTTVAGDGNPAWKDGQASSAEFSWPFGVTTRSDGNVHVADGCNHRIRLISNGQVTTAAGPDYVCEPSGFQEGPASTARLHYPFGVAADSKGDVYVADTSNHRVRKISGGQVTTVAGDGTPAFADGPAASARFNSPIGIAVDDHGKIYVADRDNHRVRVIAGGQVTTVAGDGTPAYKDGPVASARFHSPCGVAVDTDGILYVGDSQNHRLRMISAGQVTTVAGPVTDVGDVAGFQDGDASSARFSGPWGVVVDGKGNIYVADSGNHRVRMVSVAPKPVTYLVVPDGDDDYRDADPNKELLPRLRVVAQDKSGGPVPGAEVTFTIRPATATSAFPDHRSSCVVPSTDSNGIATADVLTAGPAPGDLKVEATAAEDKASFVFHVKVNGAKK
ncbi:SMP-30/gluconolactonase/LRE family protein [Embleya hyalina]|uniref:Uncharacterized protein n=1 Tax=Embleya hyalina TaxID=516124 RepID=A0A401Z4L4_9ACTN|nr:SMP-30/gluconolactonase/LRE family protein [Embleya hyalina]GCE01802.1 hypothetical protein EHYA_09576 [Embleya hyalina]